VSVARARRRASRTGLCLAVLAAATGVACRAPSPAGPNPALLAHREPGLAAFEEGKHVLAFPVAARDTHGAWDGTHYTVPVAGTYLIVAQVWVEEARRLPAYVGIQVHRETGIVAWDAAYVREPFRDSFAASLKVTRHERFAAGERIHLELFAKAPCVLAGYPYETWLSVTRQPD
jgi:hypothetical protein